MSNTLEIENSEEQFQNENSDQIDTKKGSSQKIPKFYRFEFRLVKIEYYVLTLIFLALSVFTALFIGSIFNASFNNSFWKLNVDFNSWPLIIFVGILWVLFFTWFIINSINFFSYKKEYNSQKNNFNSQVTNFVQKQFLKIHFRRNTWNWVFFAVYVVLGISILAIFLFILFQNLENYSLNESYKNASKFLLILKPNNSTSFFWRNLVIGLGVAGGIAFLLQMSFLIIFKIRINRFINFYGNTSKIVDPNYLQTRLKSVNRRNLIIFILFILTIALVIFIVINLFKKVSKK